MLAKGFQITCIALLLSCKPVLAQPNVDLSDVGQVALENTGAANAQQPFLHGLAQLHNFEYGDAADDFKEARSIDPDFALAYWGEAMTHNHPIWMQQDREKALAILNTYAPTPAARQEKTASELARDLLAAADILYGEGKKHDRDDRYMAFMAALHDKYPKNVEVAAQYALSIMGTAHEGRDFMLYMQAAALMQQFIVLYPGHPGVAHYLIHATDDPIHVPLGLKAAQAYADIAPNAAHAQHMTTHIFLALGDWDGVIRANIRALDIMNERRAANEQAAAGCGHYASWLMYGYLQQSNRDKAHEIMLRCQQNIARGEMKGTGPAYHYGWQRAMYLFDTKEWDGDIALNNADVGDDYRARFDLLVMDGFVALAQGDTEAARALYNTAEAPLDSIFSFWDKQGFAADHEPRMKPAVQRMQLNAQILFEEGKADQAIAVMREAVALESGMSFGFGPPSPPKPSHEMLGEMLIEMGRLEEAREILQTALRRTPNKRLTVDALEHLSDKIAEN
ncbi:MAG: hypothetical protein AAF564_08570 [Bacteroidota bacterium]